MAVLLIPNRSKDIGLNVTRQIVSALQSLRVTVLMPSEFAADLTLPGIRFLPEQQALATADQVLTVGGDGTLLRAGTSCAEHGKPVLGVNLGRTGFLATCEVSELPVNLKRLAEGDFSVTSRTLLEASVPERSWHATAMNDVVLFGRTRLHPMDYKVFCDGAFVSRYRSDGLIVATPTGSTAYSFSAGGPVLDAEAPVMVLTPVCAHSLHAVPLVFSASRRLTIMAEQDNRDEVYVCADSGPQCALAPGEKLVVGSAEHSLQLITFDAAEQFCAIENKLMRR
ncbi:MAG: NAD(+)/NADH kinase [Gemmiger sp.]